jgi:predicted DCC family thiol-disulfide oxidoreductase YuxK
MHYSVRPDSPSNPILLFDGFCNLCNRSVNYVIRKDKNAKFRFASLQSNFGMDTLKKLSGTVSPHGSVLLLVNGKIYNRSAAVLQTCKLLGGTIQLLYLLILIPSFIRDPIYNFVARNRYRWFGQSKECMIPTPDLESRFIS